MSYNLESVKFSRGKHTTRNEGMCLMECVAFISGEEHSDSPNCADPMISYLARIINDNIPCDNKRTEILMPFLWRIPGTKDERFEESRQAMWKKTLHYLISNGVIIDNVYGYIFSPIYTFVNDVLPHFLKLLDDMINLTEIKESPTAIPKKEMIGA